MSAIKTVKAIDLYRMCKAEVRRHRSVVDKWFWNSRVRAVYGKLTRAERKLVNKEQR